MHLPGFGPEQSLEWPRMELSEDAQHWKVTVELPGVDLADIEVLVTSRRLIIRGERRLESDRSSPPDTQERFYGQFERQIPLPTTVLEESVEASHKDGRLIVLMTKANSAATRIAIE